MPPAKANQPTADYYELWVWGDRRHATRPDYLEHKGTFASEEEALQTMNNHYTRYCSKVAVYQVSKLDVHSFVNSNPIEPSDIRMRCSGDRFTGATPGDCEKIQILMGKLVLTKKEVDEMVPLAKDREWTVRSPYPYD